ncbi:hypothetical protein G6F37_005738 [Rhizopus arrhizus]|nr:hypothetical protein G6F38_007112 [Rhizopus arrhizus]KAG1158498.1 hypothetical protein G6F37_005738 [Rhizopus arrhizus]
MSECDIFKNIWVPIINIVFEGSQVILASGDTWNSACKAQITDQDERGPYKVDLRLIISKDAIRFIGLDKTLGESLLQFAEEMEVNDAKSRYFYYLSNNCILDISNISKNTQMSYFTVSVQKLIKSKFTIAAAEYDSRSIDCLNKYFKKINSVASINKAIHAVEKYSPKNIEEKNIKRIYEYILSMHAERPWVFNKCVRSNYSEEDYKLKFWAYIIETFFAHKQSMVLQWIPNLNLDFVLVEVSGPPCSAAENYNHYRGDRNKIGKNLKYMFKAIISKKETEHKCSECNKVLSTVSALNRHLQKKHDIEPSERTRKCPRGDESEANSDTLSVATSSTSASSSGQTEDCLLN